MNESESVLLFERATEAAEFVARRIPAAPAIGVVLGSGLGGFADRITDPVVFDFREIPHFPTITVPGHTGKLVVGGVGGTRVAALQGRFHHYEGHDLDAVTFPVRVLKALGVRRLVLTAAVGGIAPSLAAGDLVAVTDHLNFLGTTPLRGPNDDRLGTRFLDLSEVYSARLRTRAEESAAGLGIALHNGVYACMPGPCYETPAEVRMLRTPGGGRGGHVHGPRGDHGPSCRDGSPCHRRRDQPCRRDLADPARPSGGAGDRPADGTAHGRVAGIAPASDRVTLSGA